MAVLLFFLPVAEAILLEEESQLYHLVLADEAEVGYGPPLLY
jgi:hypothetical protein